MKTKTTKITKTAKIKDLLGQQILFVSAIGRNPHQFPNDEFDNTICYADYNEEAIDSRCFEYVLESSCGNGFLNDGDNIIEYYAKEDYPEYFL